MWDLDTHKTSNIQDNVVKLKKLNTSMPTCDTSKRRGRYEAESDPTKLLGRCQLLSTDLRSQLCVFLGEQKD